MTIDTIGSVTKQIYELREKGNFQTLKKKIGEDKLRDFLTTLYPKFAINEIEQITGIPDSTLMHWFKQLNIPLIRNHITTFSVPCYTNGEMIVEKDNKAYKILLVEISPQLAYVIGFVLGDGSIQKWMVEAFNKDSKLKNVLLEYMAPYGTITQDERKNGLWRLRLSSGKIANLIKFKKNIREDTIDYILSNKELARQFLAAFWDAEGTVRKQGKYYHLYLYNSNKYLIDKICGFLTENGISFAIHSREKTDREYYLNGRAIKSNKALHRIAIHKPSFSVWLNEIGIYLNHSQKRQVVNEMLKRFGGN